MNRQIDIANDSGSHLLSSEAKSAQMAIIRVHLIESEDKYREFE